MVLRSLKKNASLPRLSDTSRGVAGNAAWIGAELLRMLLGVAVGAWIARHLGPAAYGEMAAVLAFVAVFQAVAAVGLDGIVVRDIARQPERAPELLGTAAALRGGTGLVCWIAAVATIAAWHGPGDARVTLTAIAGATLVLQAADAVDLWFQSQGQNRHSSLARGAAMATTAALRVALILADAPLAAFVAAVVAESLLTAAALALAYRRHRCTAPWRTQAATARMLLRECWPFIVSALAAMAHSRIDQLVIRQWAGAEAAGVYAAMLPLSMAWAVLPTALQVSLAPSIARLRAEDPAAYREALVRAFRLFFVAGVVVSVATAALAGPLVGWLYGPPFAAAAPLLAVHVFTNVFIGLGISHTLWLVNEGRFALRLYGNLVAGSLSLLANLWLVPRHGAMAAAWVAVGAQFVAAVGVNALWARDSLALQVRAVTGLRMRSR